MRKHRSEIQINRNFDRIVAARKAGLAVRMRRVAAKLREWALAENGDDIAVSAASAVSASGARARVSASLGEGGLAGAAREGRWASLWAVMESHKGEILRMLAGRDDGGE